jgi:FkbM family methyltransferase
MGKEIWRILKMAGNDLLDQARALYSDDISLKVFDAQAKAWRGVSSLESFKKSVTFPETLQFAGIDGQTAARLRQCIPQMRTSPREKYIYGAGAGCKYLLENEQAFSLVPWTGIIDNQAAGERYGLPIVTFAEFLKNHKNALVLNSVGQPAGSSIHKQCLDVGIDCVSFFEIDRSWHQYFDLPSELGLVGSGEVFVHAGCFNGDTQKSFVNWFGEKYEKMVTFEPNPEQIATCRDKLSHLHSVEIVQAGLSDQSGTVRFDLDIPGRSSISEKGAIEIKVVSIDEYMQGQPATFIALDIEGAELAALKGAEQTIKRYKPKLAICAYHKPQDMWELPLLIKGYRHDYRLYLRHYHLLDMAETVLYAL